MPDLMDETLAASAKEVWRVLVAAADADAVADRVRLIVSEMDVETSDFVGLASGIVGCVTVLAQMIRTAPDVEAARLAVCGMLTVTLSDPSPLPRA